MLPSVTERAQSALSQIVLTTQPGAGDCRELLRRIYDEAYVECIVKSALYPRGEPFSSDTFTATLNRLVKNNA